jgi:hypothetical protein
MSGETDQSFNITSDILAIGAGSYAAAKSETPSSTSSSTMADHTMVKKQIPSMYEY